MKKIFWMFVAAMAWTGCSDDNGAETPVPSDTLELSVETLAFDADGSVLEGGNEVTVTSSGEWRLGGRQLWCQPSSEQGVSGQTVTFTVEPNTEVQMREETFTFMCGGEERRLVVTQEAASEFELNGDSFELAAEGGEFKLRLESSSDTSWRFDGEVDWIHQVETRASLSFFYFEADANTTGNRREARIVVSNAEGDERTVTVLQERNLVLEATETSFEVPVEGAEIRVHMRSNLSFRVEPSVEWIVLQTTPVLSEELHEQELVFTVEPTEELFRSGIIYITTDDKSINAEISVVQGERPQGIEFPDAKFRDILVKAGYITVLDGTECLLTETGEAATQLPDLYQKGITSLKGIEAFKNLTTLAPNGIGMNPIQELDLSGNPKLTDITWYSSFSGWRSFISPAPLEVINIGDAPITEGRVIFEGLYCSPTYSASLTISGSTVKIIEFSASASSYDRAEWLDITGCPNIQSITLDSYYIKTLYVTAEQKSAIDGGSIVITDRNYYQNLKIEVR